MSDVSIDQDKLLTQQFGNPVGFFIGLDLGMARDHSAIVVNEKRVSVWSEEPFHIIRWSHRFKLGTKYGDVAREVASIMAQLPERPDKPKLFADSTGVGRPVCDQLREAGLKPVDVTLTGGANWSWLEGRVSLPKALLASTLNVGFQNNSIVMAGAMRWREQITRELEAFRVTRSDAGNDQFNARTEADHDDFVVALGLAVWGASFGGRMPKLVFI